MQPQPTYRLDLKVSQGDIAPTLRLKSLLKEAARRGFRCIAAVELEQKPEAQTADAAAAVEEGK